MVGGSRLETGCRLSELSGGGEAVQCEGGIKRLRLQGSGIYLPLCVFHKLGIPWPCTILFVRPFHLCLCVLIILDAVSPQFDFETPVTVSTLVEWGVYS